MKIRIKKKFDYRDRRAIYIYIRNRMLRNGIFYVDFNVSYVSVKNKRVRINRSTLHGRHGDYYYNLRVIVFTFRTNFRSAFGIFRFFFPRKRRTNDYNNFEKFTEQARIVRLATTRERKL